MNTEYCYHCKGRIQPWDKVKYTEEGVIHNNDDKDCYELSQNYIDEFGDVINEE